MSKAGYGSLPFAEQIEFFRQKHPELTAAWTDVYAAEHDHAFMVAGAAKADLLADFHNAIEKAIAQGTTMQEFRRDFDTIIDKHGWSYNGGRNWRTRVIFETNLRQSYAAGREAQMADPELRRRRPYGLYRHGGSADPRPEHLAWDGLVLPLDDSWWDSHTPQNGWGCKCKKLMVSEADAARLGLPVADTAPPIDWEEKTVGVRGPSPRTVRVPKGIDPGFEYRPGANRAEILSRGYMEKAAALAPAASVSAADALATSDPFRRFYGDPVGSFALAVLPEVDAAAIQAKTRTVLLSADTAKKQALVHPELAADEYRWVQRAILSGRRIQDTPKSLIYVLEDAGGYVTVVKSTHSGEAVFLTSFRRLSADEVKRDEEVSRLLRKGME